MPRLMPDARRLFLAAVACLAGAEVAAAEPSVLGCRAGIAGFYKLGHGAPFRVTASGAEGLSLEVVAPDNDGAPVAYSAEAAPTLIDAESDTYEFSGVLRVGRRDAPVLARLIDTSGDGRRIVASQLFPCDPATGLRSGLAPAERLIVEVSAAESSILPRNEKARVSRPSTVAKVSSLSELPATPRGLAGVDRVVLVIDNPSIADGVQADHPAIAALSSWVEQGGRLVIAGASGAGQLLGANGPLADLVPGRLLEIETLADAGPLERYADATDPIAGGRRLALPVARLTEVRGRVAAAAGGDADTLPLVVDAPRGLGRITFVGVDLSQGRLAEWESRPAFVSRFVSVDNPATLAAGSKPTGALVTSGSTDLSGALQQRLGARFEGVGALSMLTIVAAALVYIALIGPLDFLVTNRGLAVSGATWFTFPAIALLVGGGAWLLAGRLGGEAIRVNQIELVDVELASGAARGLLWAQAYSPHALRQDVSLKARWPDGSPIDGGGKTVSWLGAPGRGLGGVERAATGTLAADSTGSGYQQSPSGNRLLGLPINTRSSKSLLARWNAKIDPEHALVESELRSIDAGVVEGYVTNNTGADLERCVLLLGDWAWRLGALRDGAGATIEPFPTSRSGAPIKLRTYVRRDVLEGGDARASNAGRTGAGAADLRSLNADALLHLMMFTDALGETLTGLPNLHQSETDLSDQLASGRAVLLAHLPQRRSTLLAGDAPWAEAGDADGVYYRFLLEVSDGK